MTNNNLEWLLDSDWEPTEVIIHSNRNIGEEGKMYDEQLAKLYGYDSLAHLNKHNKAEPNRYNGLIRRYK